MISNPGTLPYHPFSFRITNANVTIRRQ